MGLGKPKPGPKLPYLAPPGNLAVGILLCVRNVVCMRVATGETVLRGALSWSGAPVLQAQAEGGVPTVKAVLDQCCCNAHGCKMRQLALSACNHACHPDAHLLMQLS